jgi:hypothetical protein
VGGYSSSEAPSTESCDSPLSYGVSSGFEGAALGARGRFHGLRSRSSASVRPAVQRAPFNGSPPGSGPRLARPIESAAAEGGSYKGFIVAVLPPALPDSCRDSPLLREHSGMSLEQSGYLETARDRSPVREGFGGRLCAQETALVPRSCARWVAASASAGNSLLLAVAA